MSEFKEANISQIDNGWILRTYDENYDTVLNIWFGTKVDALICLMQHLLSEAKSINGGINVNQ